MYSHLLLDDCEADLQAARRPRDGSRKQADRCKKIVAGLLHFARQNKVVRCPNDLQELVDRTMRTIHFPDKITVCVEHDPVDPVADIDRDQIVQVLTNLITNALAAMEAGGTLTIRTTGDEKPRPADRPRHGSRNPTGQHQEDFRSLLHYETDGQRDGLGIGRDLRHREDAQWRH